MCGICGVLSLDGSPVTEAVVQAMAQGLVHRGPDGSGVYVNGNVGLATLASKLLTYPQRLISL